MDRDEFTEHRVIGKLLDPDKLINILERIARAQEGMLAIAAEARQERIKLSAKMQEAMKRPLEERHD